MVQNGAAPSNGAAVAPAAGPSAEDLEAMKVCKRMGERNCKLPFTLFAEAFARRICKIDGRIARGERAKRNESADFARTTLIVGLAHLQRYQHEQQSKTKLENDLSQLRHQYEAEMARTAVVGGESAAPIDESEARRRLAALEQQLVGGEQANNEALKQKRYKKMRQAEAKMQKLAGLRARIRRRRRVACLQTR